MRSRLVIAVALSFLALPLVAQSNDVGLWIAGSRLGSTTSEGSTARFDNGNGFAASWNHYWAKHLSTEFAGAELKSDGSLQFGGVDLLNLDQLKMKALTATLQWHFAPSALIDPYAGGGAAYVKSDDLTSSDLTSAGIPPVDVEAKWGFTANAGLNVNFARNFGVGLDAKYIRYEPGSGASSGSPLELKLNPLVVALGARFRF